MLEITTILGFTIRLSIAVLLGLIIGFERQWTRHPAGILTNVIVCIGAFMFTSFSILMNSGDPTRIAAQVVSGIGFLGAGVILREGMNIRGLNTAATVWATSAVGVLCTYENIWFAVVSGSAIILSHLVFHPLSKLVAGVRFHKENVAYKERHYCVTVVVSGEAAAYIREKLMFYIKNEKTVLLRTLETKISEDDSVKIKAYISSIEKDATKVERLITQIAVEKDIISSGWKRIEE